MTALTDREREVLQLAAEGFTDKEIAHRLGIAPDTVRHHLSSIFDKLGVTNRAAATRAGMRLGVVA